jgi:hypothetical protein
MVALSTIRGSSELEQYYVWLQFNFHYEIFSVVYYTISLDQFLKVAI